MSVSLTTGLSKDEPPTLSFDKCILSELALRQAQGERVEGLTTSGDVATQDSMDIHLIPGASATPDERHAIDAALAPAPAPSTPHPARAPSTPHPAPSTKHPALGTRHLLLPAL